MTDTYPNQITLALKPDDIIQAKKKIIFCLQLLELKMAM